MPHWFFEIARGPHLVPAPDLAVATHRAPRHSVRLSRRSKLVRLRRWPQRLI